MNSTARPLVQNSNKNETALSGFLTTFKLTERKKVHKMFNIAGSKEHCVQ